MAKRINPLVVAAFNKGLDPVAEARKLSKRMQGKVLKAALGVPVSKDEQPVGLCADMLSSFADSLFESDNGQNETIDSYDSDGIESDASIS